MMMDRKMSSAIASPWRKGLKMILILLGFFMLCGLILVGFLVARSPGNPVSFRDEKGALLENSISEKVFIPINGIQQGMFIKSKNADNPVLLYLHGGLPDYFLSANYPTGLEEYFTVVWWEQRGSGLSYDPELSQESINTEQLIADTLEVSHYLRQRFQTEKIYLMGHSGGTFIGIQAAERAPTLYHAYIGIAQMSYQHESERLAYEYMLRQFKENGNTSMVRKMEAAPVTLTGDLPDGYLAIRDPAMHSLGVGTIHEMNSILTGIFLPSLTFREYTLKEKINLWRGKSQSGISAMWNDMIKVDLSQTVTDLEIPVYFFSGVYDYTVSYDLAKTYFKQVNAPVKGFYTFSQSAHSPIFEEPKKMIQIMLQDVLTGTNGLADSQ
jgi:pimeloyl-ACP methyl ester carboxylesterase